MRYTRLHQGWKFVCGELGSQAIEVNSPRPRWGGSREAWNGVSYSAGEPRVGSVSPPQAGVKDQVSRAVGTGRDGAG